MDFGLQPPIALPPLLSVIYFQKKFFSCGTIWDTNPLLILFISTLQEISGEFGRVYTNENIFFLTKKMIFISSNQ